MNKMTIPRVAVAPPMWTYPAYGLEIPDTPEGYIEVDVARVDRAISEILKQAQLFARSQSIPSLARDAAQAWEQAKTDDLRATPRWMRSPLSAGHVKVTVYNLTQIIASTKLYADSTYLLEVATLDALAALGAYDWINIISLKTPKPKIRPTRGRVDIRTAGYEKLITQKFDLIPGREGQAEYDKHLGQQYEEEYEEDERGMPHELKRFWLDGKDRLLISQSEWARFREKNIQNAGGRSEYGRFIHVFNVDASLNSLTEFPKITGEVCFSTLHETPELYRGDVKTQVAGSTVAIVMDGLGIRFKTDVWSAVGPKGERWAEHVGGQKHDEVWLVPARSRAVALIVGPRVPQAKAKIVKKAAEQLKIPLFLMEEEGLVQGAVPLKKPQQAPVPIESEYEFKSQRRTASRAAAAGRGPARRKLLLEAKRNPHDIPNVPLRASLRLERLDPTCMITLAPGVRAMGQIGQGGRTGFFTHSESREFLYLVDNNDRGCYFYRSFAGTGGKGQGVWYPVAGVLANVRGECVWIIKGSPRTDPGYGRPALEAFTRRVNEVLPHSDADVDAFIQRIDFIGDLLGDTSREIKPTLQFTQPVPYDDVLAKWGPWCLDFWKLNFLNKVWGKRAAEKTNPQAKLRADARVHLEFDDDSQGYWAAVTIFDPKIEDLDWIDEANLRDTELYANLTRLAMGGAWVKWASEEDYIKRRPGQVEYVAAGRGFGSEIVEAVAAAVERPLVLGKDSWAPSAALFDRYSGCVLPSHLKFKRAVHTDARYQPGQAAVKRAAIQGFRTGNFEEGALPRYAGNAGVRALQSDRA